MKFFLILALVAAARGAPVTESTDLSSVLHNLGDQFKHILEQSIGQVVQGLLSPIQNLGPALTQGANKRQAEIYFEELINDAKHRYEELMHHHHDHHNKRDFSQVLQGTLDNFINSIKTAFQQGAQTFIQGLMQQQASQQPAQYPAKRNVQETFHAAMESLVHQLLNVFQNAMNSHLQGQAQQQPAQYPAKRNAVDDLNNWVHEHLPQLTEEILNHAHHHGHLNVRSEFLDGLKESFNQLGDVFKHTGEGLLQTLTSQGADLLNHALQGAAQIVGQGATQLSQQLAQTNSQTDSVKRQDLPLWHHMTHGEIMHEIEEHTHSGLSAIGKREQQ